MDAQESRLNQDLADALNRWVALEGHYTANLPPVYALVPGQPLEAPAFVFDQAHVEMMTDLRNKADNARVEYNAAILAYRSYKFGAER
jgi:hypothetical protein